MPSILEELYYGNLRPGSQRHAANSPFVQAAQLKQRNLEKLMTTLDDTEKETFEKYCDAQEELSGITQYESFTYALKLGILLMAEVFGGKEQVIGEETIL